MGASESLSLRQAKVEVVLERLLDLLGLVLLLVVLLVNVKLLFFPLFLIILATRSEASSPYIL